MNDRKNRQQLIIFVKNREEGQVKTRLAATIGKKKAFQVYNMLLRITAEATKHVNAERLVSYSKYIEKDDFFKDSKFQKTVQSGVGLGERMRNAFCEGFSEKKEKIVLIGSDCPDISMEIIHHAFQKLDAAECVLGPSQDGGYYLIGLNKPIPEIFEKMRWSIGSVFDETVKRLDSVSASYHLLPVLNDIDNEEDLQKSRLSL